MGNTAAGTTEATVGTVERRSDVIAADRVRALASALDLEEIPGGGDVLPPAWHWLFFNPYARRRELGRDGHPKRSASLSGGKLARRMWAGGRLAYHHPVPIGAPVERESEIIDVVSKQGRSGGLVFATTRHRIFSSGILCIEEEQDIVYREPSPPRQVSAEPRAAPAGAKWSEPFVPDPVLLFRYSALTGNGHRIHYDQAYARTEEDYPDIVVHGPLIATLLHGLAARCRTGATLRRFEFRAVEPLFVDREFHLEAAPSGGRDDLVLWAKGPEGRLAMQAKASFGE